MIHRLDLDNSNAAELRVAEAIDRLRPQWHVIHSRWFVHGAARRYRDGEGDIIVVVPKLGFLVIEVKGASRLRVDDGQWSRYDDDAIRWVRYERPPWQQAAKVMYHFRDLVREAIGHDHFGYGFAVAFPNANLTLPLRFTAGGNVDGWQVQQSDYVKLTLDAGMLDSIDCYVEEFLQTQVGSRRCDTDLVLRVLLPNGSVLQPNHRLIAEAATQRFISLTAQQVRAANGATQNKRVVIRGGPGTGKSVIAEHLATQSARKPGRTTLLCFNRLLREDTALRLADTSVRVRTLHQFCTEIVAQNPELLEGKCRLDLPNDDAWFEFCSTVCLGRAIETGVVDQIDTLIVDEFQDLSDQQARLIRCLPAERVILLCDPNQNLFGGVGAGAAIPDGFASYTLSDNVRNCREVAMCVQAMCPPEAEHGAIATSPVMHRWPSASEFATNDELQRLIKEVLKEWKQWGFRTGRTAFLSVTRESLEHCVRALRGVNQQITTELSVWKANGGCFVGTVRSFKGLDADGVVLFDPPAPDRSPTFTRADAYVAVSRARLDFRVLHRTGIAIEWLYEAVRVAERSARC
jgi:hypothetical protein